MRRRMLKSKIHRAVVTDANLHYVGSITIDPELLAAADILEHEQVAVVDIDNGARFETYAIAGRPGSGDMCLNGAAARLVSPGDRASSSPTPITRRANWSTTSRRSCTSTPPTAGST